MENNAWADRECSIGASKPKENYLKETKICCKLREAEEKGVKMLKKIDFRGTTAVETYNFTICTSNDTQGLTSCDSIRAADLSRCPFDPLWTHR